MAGPFEILLWEEGEMIGKFQDLWARRHVRAIV